MKILTTTYKDVIEKGNCDADTINDNNAWSDDQQKAADDQDAVPIRITWIF